MPEAVAKSVSIGVNWLHAMCAGGRVRFKTDSPYIVINAKLSRVSKILPCTPYRVEKPVVYYGSSITQGGCASRPGNCYQNIVTRRLDINHINLGFSGNAKGEDEMTEFINGLDMLAFVMDYDHNSPTSETLMETHEKMFKAIRSAHPNLPIVIMERPKFTIPESEKKRCQIVRATYENALKNGDKNVYYIDHKKLMELAGDEGTVDFCHPNDLGFYSMAKAVGDVLAQIFK